MKFLKVSKDGAEDIRKRLNSGKNIDINYCVESEEDFVFFPIKEDCDFGEIVEREGIKKELRPTYFVDLLQKKLTEEELENVRNSYDVLGEVAIIEIPEELESKEEVIGQALVDFYPSLRAVFKKTSAVSGSHRTRELQRIAGEGSSETLYKEHGCRYKFDVATVFFTERLATEREIVADQVGAGEVVVDMFAGAGPFSILIAKRHPDVEKIHAIDINHDAVEYMKVNISLNKVDEKIDAIEGDACDLIDKEFLGVADRVIMNLPKTGKDFLPWAVKALKKEGIIHYYTFKRDEEEVKQEISEKLEQLEVKEYKIKEIRRVKPYAPREWTYGADLYIKKENKE